MSEITVSSRKSRLSLMELVETLDRLRRSKRDFVADVRTLMVVANASLSLAAKPGHTAAFDDFLPFTQKGLEQLGERLSPSVPSKFLRAYSAKYPHDCARTLTTLLGGSGDDPETKTNLIRCLDGKVRAVLSPKYKILDHWDTAIQTLDVAKEFNAYPVECDLTDSHMRIKLTTQSVFDMVNYRNHGGPSADILRTIAPQLKDDKDTRNTVHPYIVITNSETGDGGFNISTGIFDPVCKNGLVIDRAMRAVHIGRELSIGTLSQEAIEADSKAIMLKARDLLRAAFNPEVFKAQVAKVQAAAGEKIDNPVAAIQEVITTNNLPESLSESILSHFMDYDKSKFGLASAVSRMAQDVEDSSLASDLESIAGRLLAV
jgi:hypothetical protein